RPRTASPARTARAAEPRAAGPRTASSAGAARAAGSRSARPTPGNRQGSDEPERQQSGAGARRQREPEGSRPTWFRAAGSTQGTPAGGGLPGPESRREHGPGQTGGAETAFGGGAGRARWPESQGP